MPQFITSPLAQQRDKSNLLGWNGQAGLAEASRYGDIRRAEMAKAAQLHMMQQLGMIRGFSTGTDQATQAWLMPQMTDYKAPEQPPAPAPAPAPEPVAPPPAQLPAPPLDKLPVQASAGMNFDLGKAGANQNHFSNMNSEGAFTNYQFTDDQNKKFDELLGYANGSADYFKSNPINIYTGTDATKVTKETIGKLKEEFGLDDLSEEQANYILNTNRGDTLKKAIVEKAREKGLDLNDEHFKISNYRGNKVHSNEQRFVDFGMEGTYDPNSKTLTTKNKEKSYTGMSLSDTADMQDWRKKLNPKSAQRKSQTTKQPMKRTL